jgi:TetR/AcrR family transcriptional regulator, cholesterol catabolism regulator
MSKVKMKQTQSRRERKKQETRQRLLECAWQLFQQRGYDDTTVEGITEAADVAKGTFFNYFATKEALLDEIALWRIELLGSQVLAADDVPEGAVARIKRLVRAMAVEFSPDRELPRHLLIARISAPVRHESAHRLGSIVHDLVQHGQADGEIRADLDAGLIARLLLTSAFYHFMWFHHPGDKHPPQASAKDAPASPGQDTAPQPCGPGTRNAEYAKRNTEHTTRNSQLSLEAKLIESIDALMDGLGGPSWRNS